MPNLKAYLKDLAKRMEASRPRPAELDSAPIVVMERPSDTAPEAVTEPDPEPLWTYFVDLLEDGHEPAVLPYNCGRCRREVHLRRREPGLYGYKCRCGNEATVSAESYAGLRRYDKELLGL